MPKITCRVIISCGVLHNIAKTNNIPLNDDEEDDNLDDDMEEDDNLDDDMEEDDNLDDDMEEVDNRVGGIGFALRKTVTELHF